MTAGRLIVSCFSLLALTAAACASKENASPPDIGFDVEFPSVAAAVALDNVKLYVFDGALNCNDLVRKRQTDQALPATLVEKPVAPCDIRRGAAVDFEVALRSTVTVLAVGQAAGADLLIGCVVESDFGSTKALPVSLTYIDATKRIPNTACSRLSDKCNGACK